MNKKFIKTVKQVFNEISESFETFGKVYAERYQEHK